MIESRTPWIALRDSLHLRRARGPRGEEVGVHEADEAAHRSFSGERRGVPGRGGPWAVDRVGAGERVWGGRCTSPWTRTRGDRRRAAGRAATGATAGARGLARSCANARANAYAGVVHGDVVRGAVGTSVTRNRAMRRRERMMVRRRGRGRSRVAKRLVRARRDDRGASARETRAARARADARSATRSIAVATCEVAGRERRSSSRRDRAWSNLASWFFTPARTSSDDGSARSRETRPDVRS